MSAASLRGAILEYLVRKLFIKCGFTSVLADKIYTFNRGHLFMINGKGAAHDADVLMQPPIQIPFSIPTQILFECKAYSTRKIGLPILRNALGLRNDINDFEIVTHASLMRRQNNRRTQLAVEQRDRHWVQVGVAAVNDFSKPAIEFALNNKIPLLSLSWYLLPTTINSINGIDDASLASYSEDEIKKMVDALKDRVDDINSPKHSSAYAAFERMGIVGDILSYGNYITNLKLIGLLDSGSMIFLTPTSGIETLNRVIAEGHLDLKAEIYFLENRRSKWTMKIYPNENRDLSAELEFSLPREILSEWSKKGMTTREAPNIKETRFSRITLFHNQEGVNMPISFVTLNQQWLRGIREQLGNAV